MCRSISPKPPRQGKTHNTRMQITNHWLSSAKRLESPHFNERPHGVEPNVLVIHCASLPAGSYGTTHMQDLFLGQLDVDAHESFASLAQVRVSAHLVIDRKGAIAQFVPFDRRAWHAGVSRFGDKEDVNDFSIGIELEGVPSDSFSERQYQCLGEVSKALLHAYPGITPERIVGHCDIAPERKIDPGPNFDWKRYLDSVRAAQNLA